MFLKIFIEIFVYQMDRAPPVIFIVQPVSFPYSKRKDLNAFLNKYPKISRYSLWGQETLKRSEKRNEITSKKLKPKDRTYN